MKPQSNEQNSWEPTSAPRDSSLGKPRPQMQTPIRINRIVVGDYYHVTTMDESMSWMKLAHRQANFSLTLRPPFVHLPLLKRFLITFSNVHTKEEQDLSLALSLTYIMYADASNNTPFYTHVNLYVAWRVPPPKVRLSLLIYLDVKFSFVCDLRFKSFFFLVIFLKIRHTILGLEIKCSLLNIVCFKIRLSLDFDFKINYLCSLSQNHNYLCSLTQDQVLNILCFKVSFFAYCLKTILFLSLFFIFCLWL